MKKINLCLLGASGAVGQEMLKVLEEKNFPIENLRLLGNSSAGQKVSFKGQDYTIEKVSKDSFKDMDITLVAVGADESKKYSPLAAAAGSIVIDNSSAFRMDKNVPLVLSKSTPDGQKLYGLLNPVLLRKQVASFPNARLHALLDSLPEDANGILIYATLK